MIGNYIGSPIGAITAQAGGDLVIPATGTAAGTSTAVGYLQGRVLLTGLSQGTSTANGQSVTNETTGNAAGNATVLGVGASKVSIRGTAAGHATVLGVSNVTVQVSMVGLAQGTCSIRGKIEAKGDIYITTPDVLPAFITTKVPKQGIVTTARSSYNQITR